MALHFEDIKPAIGARVSWDDRNDIFTPEAAQLIREKVEERTVLVFPKLNLTDEEQLALTDTMGGTLKLTGQFNKQNVADDNVYQVTLDKDINPQPEYVLGTYFWHMDGMPIDAPPPFATMLSARSVAPKGGQTEFASTWAAWEGLPEEEKAELDGLKTVHSVRASMIPLSGAIPDDQYEKVIGIQTEKVHPLVWHRANGRKNLLIGSTAERIVGMPVVDGRALLWRLTEWAAQPDYSLRHDWQEGDFVIWDNTSAMHRALPYDADSGRMMHRTTLVGAEATNA
jgi:alpha-ketoglutarate-dependent taurine dioxygenase